MASFGRLLAEGAKDFAAGVYKDVLEEKIMQQLQQQEVNDDENL